MATNNSVKNALQQQGANAPVQTGRVDPFKDTMRRMNKEIQDALPKHISVEHFSRVVTTEVKKNPELANCNPASLMSAILLSAQLGLEVGTFGHCYFIPYKQQVQFQIGYRGLIELIMRSGKVTNVFAHPVYSNDEFSVELGCKPDIVHKPFMNGDRGELVSFYAVAVLRDGAPQFEWMSLQEVNEHRKQYSKAGNSSPWNTAFVEMAKKTVVKRLSKFLPLSVEIFKGIGQDEQTKTEIIPDIASNSQDNFDFETMPEAETIE